MVFFDLALHTPGLFSSLEGNIKIPSDEEGWDLCSLSGAIIGHFGRSVRSRPNSRPSPGG